MDTTTEPPTLARRILDLTREETEVFMGLVAGHFAAKGAIDRETAARYVDEALAVSK
jgi:hypothetical protein